MPRAYDLLQVPVQSGCLGATPPDPERILQVSSLGEAQLDDFPPRLVLSLSSHMFSWSSGGSTGGQVVPDGYSCVWQLNATVGWNAYILLHVTSHPPGVRTDFFTR